MNRAKYPTIEELEMLQEETDRYYEEMWEEEEKWREQTKIYIANQQNEEQTK